MALNLHTKDGGHHFNGGVSFPMDLTEQAGEPLYTPDDMSAWAVFAQIAAISIAAALVVLAVHHLLAR